MSWDAWIEFYWNAKAIEGAIGVIALVVLLVSAPVVWAVRRWRDE